MPRPVRDRRLEHQPANGPPTRPREPRRSDCMLSTPLGTRPAQPNPRLYRLKDEERSSDITGDWVEKKGGPTDRHQPRPWRLDRDDAGRDIWIYPNALSRGV